jgi:hypothetical protein
MLSPEYLYLPPMFFRPPDSKISRRMIPLTCVPSVQAPPRDLRPRLGVRRLHTLVHGFQVQRLGVGRAVCECEFTSHDGGSSYMGPSHRARHHQIWWFHSYRRICPRDVHGASSARSRFGARSSQLALTTPGRGWRKVLCPHDEASRRVRPVRYETYQRSVVGSARSKEGFPERADGCGGKGTA